MYEIPVVTLLPAAFLKVNAPFVVETVKMRLAELYKSTMVVETPSVLGAIISECQVNSSVGMGFPETFPSIMLSQLPLLETPLVLPTELKVNPCPYAV